MAIPALQQWPCKEMEGLAIKLLLPAVKTVCINGHNLEPTSRVVGGSKGLFMHQGSSQLIAALHTQKGPLEQHNWLSSERQIGLYTPCCVNLQCVSGLFGFSRGLQWTVHLTCNRNMGGRDLKYGGRHGNVILQKTNMV